MVKERHRYRPLSDVLREDALNFAYFFAPLVVVHNLGWAIKPLLTSDPRGPWEIIWNLTVDFLGDDRRWLHVYGWNSLLSMRRSSKQSKSSFIRHSFGDNNLVLVHRLVLPRPGLDSEAGLSIQI